ncbi:MAG TPA: hypothetical protein VNZ52_07855 [Candidatus Thermoplasmatota archaeon]|nr:hypothetical protein [Candidatus Thermoplasmatota archaeon]
MGHRLPPGGEQLKGNRRDRSRRFADDRAGSEVVGALILFGLFVGVIALLNTTAVPQAGLTNEVGHFDTVVDRLNGLQASAEAAGTPGFEGATVSAAVPLGPPRSVGQDFFSYFMGTPARAAGSLDFVASYGNITLYHYASGNPTPVVDVGNLTARLPLGRLTFNQNPYFRNEAAATLENGAVILDEGATPTLRYDPPITVNVSGGVTHLTVKTRLLAGVNQSVGGTADVRVGLLAAAATLDTPVSANAERTVLRLETAYGSAWGSYLNATAAEAGLLAGSGYTTVVSPGAGEGGLDVVTWTVLGTGAGNDIRLVSGLAVYEPRFS